MLANGFRFLVGKLGDMINGLLSSAATGAGIVTNELTPIFIVIAMIGVLLTMMGNKKWGTKLSSLSFLVYLIFKVVLRC